MSRWYHRRTHVLVNDPTTGYGIFIENMLDAAA
ncbi:MAG: SpoIVB peptidase S55 domain-containing protein [Oscillospiraceae bacterium]